MLKYNYNKESKYSLYFFPNTEAVPQPRPRSPPRLTSKTPLPLLYFAFFFLFCHPLQVCTLSVSEFHLNIALFSISRQKKTNKERLFLIILITVSRLRLTRCFGSPRTCLISFVRSFSPSDQCRFCTSEERKMIYLWSKEERAWYVTPFAQVNTKTGRALNNSGIKKKKKKRKAL